MNGNQPTISHELTLEVSTTRLRVYLHVSLRIRGLSLLLRARRSCLRVRVLRGRELSSGRTSTRAAQEAGTAIGRQSSQAESGTRENRCWVRGRVTSELSVCAFGRDSGGLGVNVLPASETGSLPLSGGRRARPPR
jgi:hypothetical protein